MNPPVLRLALVCALVFGIHLPVSAQAPVEARSVSVELAPEGTGLRGTARWTLDVPISPDSLVTLDWYAGPMRVDEVAVMLPDTTVRLLPLERAGDSVRVLLATDGLPRPLRLALRYSAPPLFEARGIRWLGAEREAAPAWVPHLAGIVPERLTLDLSAFDGDPLGGTPLAAADSAGAPLIEYDRTPLGDILVVLTDAEDVLRVAAAAFPVRLIGVPEPLLDQVTYDVDRITRYLAARLGASFPHEGLTLGFVDRLAPFQRAGAGVVLVSADGLRLESTRLEGVPVFLLAEALARNWLDAKRLAEVAPQAMRGASALLAYDYLASSVGADVAAPLLFEARRYALGAGAFAVDDAALALRALWRGHQARVQLGGDRFDATLPSLATASSSRGRSVLLDVLDMPAEAAPASVTSAYGAAARELDLAAETLPPTDSTQTDEYPVAPRTLDVAVQSLGGRETFAVPIDSEPLRVPFSFRPRSLVADPTLRYPAASYVRQPPSAWISVVLSDAPTLSRLLAATALREALADTSFAEDGALGLALADALAREPNATVVGALLRAVAPDSALALPLFEAALSDPLSRVRVAALHALSPRHVALFPKVMAVAQSDSVHEVIAEAVEAAARLAPEDDRTEALVRAALVTPTPGDVVQVAGLRALARLGLRTNDLQRSIDTVTESTSSPALLAASAIPLAVVAETRSAARRTLTELGAHPDPGVRAAAYRALARAGTGNALVALDELAETEQHPGNRAILQRLRPSASQ